MVSIYFLKTYPCHEVVSSWGPCLPETPLKWLEEPKSPRIARAQPVQIAKDIKHLSRLCVQIISTLGRAGTLGPVELEQLLDKC